MSHIHQDIRPFTAYLKEKYLYNLDPEKKGLERCKVFSVSSYPGDTLTFQVHLESSGGIFAYIPFHALLLTDKAPEREYELAELISQNCPDDHFSLSYLDYLRQLKVAAYLQKKHWVAGTYLFTIDWFRRNDLLNVIALDNGQICAQPYFRTLYLKPDQKLETLPPYKKIKAEWRV